MYKKYTNAVEYKSDLIVSINLVSECMSKIEKKLVDFGNFHEADLKCATSAGLSYLLKRLNIDSNILSNRLKYTDGLIKNPNINYIEYKQATNEALDNLRSEISSELKYCSDKLMCIEDGNVYLAVKVKDYVAKVYQYIVKNILKESFEFTCEKKRIKENVKIDEYLSYRS